MNKMMSLAFTAAVFLLAACNNESTRTGAVDDTARVSPPSEKVQDSISLTDTSYNIGDSARQGRMSDSTRN